MERRGFLRPIFVPLQAINPDNRAESGNLNHMNIEDIRTYCLEKPMATEDMPFGDDYVTFRVGEKIFCGIALTQGKVVQLKWSPEEFDAVTREYSYVRQAWHWHKRHMIQFDLEEYPIPDAVVTALIDRSYDYVVSRLPRKTRIALGLSEPA